jgi:DNA primase
MSLPKEFIADLKRRIDLAELVDEYTDLTKGYDNDWFGCCPHPNHNDPTPSFHVRETSEGQKWFCFGCNTGGDCIDFIMWIEDMQWKDAIMYLANKYNIPMPKSKYEKEYKRNKMLANKYQKDIKERAYKYLYDRGLSNDDISKWNIGYDKYNDRIVFPMADKYGNIIGFNKRIIESKNKHDKKYIHSPGSEIFKKSQYLYGTNHINKKHEYIIITEGVMDVILATKYGLQNVVCTLGVALTKEHIPYLKSLNKTVILIYDGDSKGIEAINKAANLLLDNDIYCKTVILPDGKDLADISLEYKYKLPNYIENSMCTYGYYNAKNAVDDYIKELYELKLRYQPIVNNIIKKVPNQEKNTIKSFLENEIGLKVTN